MTELAPRHLRPRLGPFKETQKFRRYARTKFCNGMRASTGYSLARRVLVYRSCMFSPCPVVTFLGWSRADGHRAGDAFGARKLLPDRS